MRGDAIGYAHDPAFSSSNPDSQTVGRSRGRWRRSGHHPFRTPNCRASCLYRVRGASRDIGDPSRSPLREEDRTRFGGGSGREAAASRGRLGRVGHSHTQIILRGPQERIESPVQMRVGAALQGLRENPDPGRRQRLCLRGLRSWRTGDNRIVYLTIETRIDVLVVAVGHRRDVTRSSESECES